MEQNYSMQNPAQSVLATNRVLRNTYLLLSMTLLFSAAMAFVAIRTNMAPFSPWVFLGGALGLLFVTQALRNSAWGLLSVFALTGFFGLTMGPIISLYVQAFSNGSEIVMLAMGGTGIVFLTMSGIALTSKRDFSGLGQFLFMGILVAFLAGIANIFLKIPALGLAVSSVFVLLSSGLLLWQTQAIVRGGETNYISATVTLFVSIYNVFSGLLHILGFALGED
ncbi:MAG: Bax inhibitor-1/YccA family protein [Lysobacterales bacterium]